VRPVDEVVGDIADIAEISDPPNRVLSATIHIFNIRAEKRIFKVTVLGAEARIPESES
jgi:hypothetical protein